MEIVSNLGKELIVLEIYHFYFFYQSEWGEKSVLFGKKEIKGLIVW